MKQSRVMHYISTTKYSEEYLNIIENKYERIKEFFRL
jgi:hypothetical protein